MPTLPTLFFTLNRLKVDWVWHISEGPAANVKDTAWCKQQPARYSEDGTHEFLQMIWNHPRVRIAGRQMWTGGKVEMVNHSLPNIREESVLLQCDADELWEAWQIEQLVRTFEQLDDVDAASFYCRYFVGVNILSTKTNTYGNNPGEWRRAWRFRPGDKFISHEPPVMSRTPRRTLDREETRDLGLVFDHYSWAFANQVAYKEQFYGYPNALDRWQSLQAQALRNSFPVRLKDYLPWVDPNASADLIK
jgi:hypothetical protein